MSNAHQTTHQIQTFKEWDNQRKQEALNFGIGLFAIATLSLAIAMLFILGSCRPAHAEIAEDQAVQCILGEARGEGYESMLAHAEAIRNRGNLKGVCGCRARFQNEMPYLKAKGIISQAKTAWNESKHTNTVKGADHWGSTKIDGKWISEMKRKGFIQTAMVKNTAFYKAGSK